MSCEMIRRQKKNEGMQLEKTQHVQRGQTQTHSNLAVSGAECPPKCVLTSPDAHLYNLLNQFKST